MIINALSEAYDRLCSNSNIEITRGGYSYEKVPYVAIIDNDGKLTDLISNTKTIYQNGKTKDEVKKERLPERISPRSSVRPNFLCDSFSYMFGLEVSDISDDGGKKIKVLKQTDKAKKSFNGFKEKIFNDLKDVPGERADAIKRFYEHWNPENEIRNDLFFYKDKDGKEKVKDLNGTIIFALYSVNFKTIDDKDILNKWESLQKGGSNTTEEKTTAQCCISGKKSIIAKTHPSIRGVKGSQTSGAAIVSYNRPAFESYNKSQSYNGPVSEIIAKKYTAALNYFLRSESKNKITIGKETLVFWAESENEDYVDDFLDLYGLKQTESIEEATESKIMSALNLIRNGQSPTDFSTDESTRFHILVLSPNAGRLSIRRYYNTTFGALEDNVLQHYKDTMLLYSRGEFKQITFWKISDATIPSVITKDRTSGVNANFVGTLLEAVLNNSQYPSALFTEMIARIKTDHAATDEKARVARLINLTNIRAAFIKAYLVRKDRKCNKKEEITLELNKENQNEGYLLGRLFAIMEKTQQDAIPKLNSTIKDRFFASACSTPAKVFPSLLIGYQNHIAKLEGKGIRYEKLLDEVVSKLNDSFPKQLDLDGQGRFILGYYQQRADFWKKQDNGTQDENNKEEN